MSVTNQHPQYQKYLPKWQRCRDCSDGGDAVHAKGDAYLPRLKEQEQVDYESYNKRATFFNATWRTIAGMLGMLFRKAPEIAVPSVAEPMLNAITSDGVPFRIFLMGVAEEALKIGRLGVMVDVPVRDDRVIKTLADQQAANIRPTMCIYQAESIINWKTSVVNNLRILSMVVLKEETEIPVDEFQSKCETRYRVLDLEPSSLKYRVRIFASKDNQDILLSEVYPIMNGFPLNFIPFYFISSDDTDSDCDEPPLIDLVDMNLAHYRVTADYEHGCHFTGLPTGYITGHRLDDGDKIYLGSQSMIVLPNDQAKVGFLELSGAGLINLENNLKSKEQKMAVLGARMLEEQKRGVETAEVAAIHRSGEQSVLASVAQTISIAMTAALKTFSLWAGGDDADVEVEINRDFFPMPMDAQALTALVGAWIQGGLPKESLFTQLQRGELVDPDMTFEEFEAALVNSGPLSGIPSFTEEGITN